MIKVEVFTEVRDRDRDRVEARTVPTWLNTGEVFSVTAHEDAAWSVLTFVASAGRRPIIVQGEADTVAALINADGWRQRRPARRARPITTRADQAGSEGATRG